MYFKSTDNRTKINIPIGYKGTAFSAPKEERIEPQKPSLPVFPRPVMPEAKEMPLQDDISAESKAHRTACENCAVCEANDPTPEKASRLPLISDGGLDAEELLILAIALIVFQGGKENELALLLLALLFIK